MTEAPKRKGGRQLKVTPSVIERARELIAAGASVEEAAKALEVGKTQLYARLGLQEAQGGSTAAPGTHALASVSKVASGATGGPALPQGGDVANRPDLLALVRRILDARDPAARRELDEGLALFTRGGEEALTPWLARPAEAMRAEDPLVEVMGALGRIKAQIEALPPGHTRAASTAQALAVLAKGAEQIRRGRPEPESEDALLVRIGAVRAQTLELLEATVRAEERAAGLP